MIIEFQDGDTLIFNASRPSHRDFIDKILIDLKATAANWKTEFSPSLDKQKKDVLYEKTTSANSMLAIAAGLAQIWKFVFLL